MKLWELEKGLAGLALSVAAAFFVTQATKNLFGKPRPNSIAACIPDLSRVEKYSVDGYGTTIDDGWTLVSAAICSNPDIKLVNDAFRSFPSGHSTVSWAGMLYLTLFLCSKFAIIIPHLPANSLSPSSSSDYAPDQLPLHEATGSTYPHAPDPNSRKLSVRDIAASPPNHLIIVAFLPLAVALFICASRFFDFYHHGLDIISGSVIGILSSYFAFRWYHLPLGRGEGWAWGPRSTECAFGVGVGVASYAEQRT